ncbi:uncharacterized protein TM35_000016690 [Trypanosoma theileri]|uniref:SET domain-containing protein n=1 Tax=Trypanosoma theileri TaxID=67003 RepID=A0A1X0PA34_9TRYP|nr:uncharacterized protein TM35_000016690 [Trypanosoma theileri]ORC93792.1 hypothetical protein TM35_000016690 [Trypanosoma theileri]
MRGQRSAKFAEYTATYAILKRLGIHDTVLIEKRDASVGYGIFVKDACDAGTPLIVVPSRQVCSVTTLDKLGANIKMMKCRDLEKLQALNNGVVSKLLGCKAEQWVTLAWRLSIEQQRALSPWWGWLNVLPDAQAFKTIEEESERKCRLHHTSLLPYLVHARCGIEREVTAVYEMLGKENIMASPSYFRNAVNVILSRAQHLPKCWTTAEGDPIELGIIPFIDLINIHDGVDRKRNASLEVAFAFEELPEWYRSWFIQELEPRGIDGEKELHRLIEEHYFALLVLEQDLTASEEVILQCELEPWETGTLSSQEELLLGRLLRYFF